MSLEMRPECGHCGTGFTDGGIAFICSYECTFRADCAAGMNHACPNCGGELVARPKRRSKGLAS